MSHPGHLPTLRHPYGLPSGLVTLTCSLAGTIFLS
jgi:hypothetical protein